MADDIRIDIKVTGNQNVVSAIKSTEGLEASVRKLSQTYDRGGISQAKAAKGVEQLAKKYKKSESDLIAYGKAISDASKKEKESKAAAAALKTEIKNLTAARREATEINNRFNAAAKAEALALRQVAKEVKIAKDARRALRMEFKEGYAAQVQYRAARMRLSQAEREGILTTQQAAAAQKNLGIQTMVGGRAVSRSGVLTQQAGYQMGDFLVQVQGGTNWMVAFGQQATQMVGALNYLPNTVLQSTKSIFGLRVSVIALIASAGILIPLITAVGAFWMRSREATNKAKESISKLEEGLKSLDNTLADWVQTKKAASMGITTEELLGLGGIDKAKQDLEDVVNKLKSLQESDLYSGPLGGFNRFMTGGSALEAAGQKEIEEAKLKIKQAEERLNNLLYQQDQDRLTIAREEIAELSRKTELSRLALKYGEDSVEYKRLEETYAKASFVASQLDKGIKGEILGLLIETYDAEVAISGVDMTTNIQNAANAAATLASNFRAALNNANQIAQAQNQLAQMKFEYSPGGQALTKYGGRGGTNDTPVTDSRGFVLENGKFIDPNAPKGSSGRSSVGGGKGGGSGVKSHADIAKEAVEKLQDQLNLQKELIGKSEEYLTVRNALGDSYSKIEPAQIANLQAQVVAIEAMKQAEADRKAIVDTVADSIGAGLTSIVDGTKSVKGAFKDMARAVISELWKVFVVQKLVAGVKTLFGFADGGVFSGGAVDKKFANGGVVGGPTTFPMAGGKTGLMGEAGPEAIMPLKRGKNGKLGVSAEGGGSQNVTVVQNFNFQANGDESVKKIIAQAAPSISAMAQKGMMDQRRRGGAMKSTFG